MRDIVVSVMHLGPVYPHTVNTDRFANGPWATARQVRHALRGTHADCCGIESDHVRVTAWCQTTSTLYAIEIGGVAGKPAHALLQGKDAQFTDPVRE